MKLYKALVNIGGSRDHQVWKYDLTAAEMKLLEHIHVSPQGHPVLGRIEHTGNVNRSDRNERARLAGEYTKGELVEDRGQKLIASLFGVAGVPLPQEYEPPTAVQPDEIDPADEEEEVITPVEEIVVRTRPRRRAEAEAA